MNPAKLSELGIRELGKEFLVPRTLIRPFLGQPREYFDPQELKQLTASIKRYGQLVPVPVKELENGSLHKFELIDGQRRWHATEMAGIPDVKVIIREVKDVEHQFLMSVVSNFGKADHSTPEIVNAILRFRKNNMTGDEIAEVFSMSRGWVTQHVRIAEALHPDVLKMMSPEIPEDERLGFTAAFLVTDAPRELQPSIAKTIVSEKLKLIQVKDYLHRQGKKHNFTVGNPERTPGKDYEIVRNFLHKMQRELRVFNDKPKEFFKDMFQSRDDEGHQKLLTMLKRNMEDMKTLEGVLLAAKPAKK